MTTTTPEATQTSVECVQLGDGKLVRLSGRVGADEVPGLRHALLSPLVRGCGDVVVDGGHIESICDEAVAVLVAAPEWAHSMGSRFFLSCASPALSRTLCELGVEELLPRLG